MKTDNENANKKALKRDNNLDLFLEEQSCNGENHVTSFLVEVSRYVQNTK